MSEDKEEAEDEYDYDKLLGRAQEDLPEEISSHERFTVPDVDALIEGNTTIVKNFEDIADKINREPQKLLKFLLRELGTAGEMEENRVVFKGKINPNEIEEKLEDYIEKYVLCSECGRPDTHLVKEDRVTLIKCDACGAHRPIKGKVKKAHTSGDSDEIEEGGTYEVMIQDIGKEGDGVAKKGKYTIFVSGTTKGEKVKIRINKIKGTLGFASVVER